MSAPKLNNEFELALLEDIAKYQYDPYGYVLYSFPWGELGSELEKHKGPRDWQRDVLTDISNKLKAGSIDVMEAVQIAIASGHGIGKSALVSWIILWALSTFEDTKGVVTANTENQLKTKTWAEVAKWHRLSINSHWFVFTATAIYSADPSHEKTWRIDMVPWSERNTEAFAGLHNEGKRVLLVFDEASGIPDLIWEVSEGALTDDDTEIIWCAFGNPTRNDGRFKHCFGRFKHRWLTRQIDSRTVAGTNKAQLQKWVEDYGEDSDFVRVRVRGGFPSAGTNQFIPSTSVSEGMKADMEPEIYMGMPLVLGVDVARFGADQTVIALRQGRKFFPLFKYRELDTMQTAARVAEKIKEFRPNAVFVDVVGIGAGVVDRLRMLGYDIIESNGANTAESKEIYVNKRAEMWGRMKNMLMDGADLPDDSELEDELISVEYSYNSKQQIVLEGKDDMKKRGFSSPDCADAFAITFTEDVMIGGEDSFEPEVWG